MSIDITITAESASVERDQYRGIILELTRAELVEAVEIKDIVGEYTATYLLDEIGQTDVIAWLESEGYDVTESE